MWNSTNKLEKRSCVAALMIKVAKSKDDFTPMTSDGEAIVQLITFKNVFKGYETIKDSLSYLDHSQKIKIKLESTGHYHKNLVKF